MISFVVLVVIKLKFYISKGFGFIIICIKGLIIFFNCVFISKIINSNWGKYVYEYFFIV